MAKVLDMPKLSPTMEEGQISAWRKKEGDQVEVDDLLADVETDKATMEYRAFDRGTLLRILAPDGAVVRLGDPVAILGEPGEDVSALLAKHAPAAAPTPMASPAPPAPAAPTAPGKPSAPAAPSTTPEASPTPAASGRVKASPYVRKLARERGLELRGVAGSGPQGRIVARDLEKVAAAAPEVAWTPATPTGELAAPEVRPLSMMRKAIARRLTESKQSVPHFYLSIDVDADALVLLRERINEDLATAGPDGGAIKVSLNDLLVKACAMALTRVPEANAQFTPEALLMHRRVDISVAVAVADGLVTPVVRDAERRSVVEISTIVRELAARAKAKKLRPEEMANGTFSISNLGMYGIDDFAAVINPPEGAILAIGRVRREPVVRGEQIVPGYRLGMTLSCDHRAIDGAVGATFLRALRALLERPMQLLAL
jgi:pyruvate dehydrogenase E2 component (dihydrolipoamide acetyltransferase)